MPSPCGRGSKLPTGKADAAHRRWDRSGARQGTYASPVSASPCRRRTPAHVRASLLRRGRCPLPLPTRAVSRRGLAEVFGCAGVQDQSCSEKPLSRNLGTSRRSCSGTFSGSSVCKLMGSGSEGNRKVERLLDATGGPRLPSGPSLARRSPPHAAPLSAGSQQQCRDLAPRGTASTPSRC